MAEEPNEVELDVDPTPNEPTPDQDLKRNLFRLHISLWNYLKDITNISEGTDYAGTVDGIKRDIDFKGHGVWILVVSIFIASIGLNVNSTAVIIGAMLISPLMGPILGVGLSVGTNDWQTLIRSVKSFGNMTLIALFTSTLYFFLTPLNEVQPELIARTKPTILDVFIAIFGGIAGIVAGSRKEKSNVIPGVAIATALMPPLCTAGYGLANGNWPFFLGAFYLFFLNSLFISISTVLIVRFLKFPIVSFVDSATEKKVKRYLWTFVLIIIIPSTVIFWGVLKESIFHQKADQFVEENFNFEGTRVNAQIITYTDTLATIEVSLVGDILSEEVKQSIQNRLALYGLTKTFFISNTTDKVKLKIYQSNDSSAEIAALNKKLEETRYENVEEQLQRNIEIIDTKNREIRHLKRKILKLKGDSIPLNKIEREIKLQYEDVERLSYARSISVNPATLTPDTIPCLLIGWKPQTKNEQEQQEKLKNWLQLRLELDTLQVVRY